MKELGFVGCITVFGELGNVVVGIMMEDIRVVMDTLSK